MIETYKQNIHLRIHLHHDSLGSNTQLVNIVHLQFIESRASPKDVSNSGIRRLHLRQLLKHAAFQLQLPDQYSRWHRQSKRVEPRPRGPSPVKVSPRRTCSSRKPSASCICPIFANAAQRSWSRRSGRHMTSRLGDWHLVIQEAQLPLQAM